MNRPITSAKIENVILKLPKKTKKNKNPKCPGPDGFSTEF